MVMLRTRRVIVKIGTVTVHLDLVMGDADNPEEEALSFLVGAGVKQSAIEYVGWEFAD